MEAYTIGYALIDPADDDIVWNGIEDRWEITFNVTDAFGGFFVQAGTQVLPLQWISINAILNNQKQPVITWRVQEQNVLNYSVEQSNDGIHFSAIGNLNAGVMEKTVILLQDCNKRVVIIFTV